MLDSGPGSHANRKRLGGRQDAGATLRRRGTGLCGGGGGGGVDGGGNVDGMAVEEAAEALDGFVDG